MEGGIVASYRRSSLYSTFNLRDELARGRCSLLLTDFLWCIVTSLTTGVFYTGFMLSNGMKAVNIGLLSMVPMVCSVFGLLSPMILRRFQKRKTFLLAMRFAYILLNIGGITVVPLFSLPQSVVQILFFVLIFLSNVLLFIFDPGFVEWHINYYPDNVRLSFFSFKLIASGVMSAVTLLVSGLITDSVSGSDNELGVIIVLRFVAFGVAVFQNFFVFGRMKEFPYKTPEDGGKKTSLLVALKYKRFLLTIALYCGWCFAANLPSSSWDVYMLQNIGAKYSFLNAVQALYALFPLLLTVFWKKLISKMRWLKAYALSVMIYGPAVMLFIFLQPSNYVFLYIVIKLLAFFASVGLNITAANILYLNIPEENRTSCVAFYTMAANLCSFAGMGLGTLYLGVTEGMSFSMLGLTVSNLQLSVFIHGAAVLALGIISMWAAPKLEKSE